MMGRDNKIGEGGSKHCCAIRRDYIARPRRGSVSCNDFEKAPSSFYPLSTRDDAEFGRSRRITGDANVKHGSAISQIGAKAHVGGKVVEAECAAAIDGD
jgi:hypothetical protein